MPDLTDPTPDHAARPRSAFDIALFLGGKHLWDEGQPEVDASLDASGHRIEFAPHLSRWWPGRALTADQIRAVSYFLGANQGSRAGSFKMRDALASELSALADQVRRLEEENARLTTSTREAWDRVNTAGKGEWGEFPDADGRKWTVRYWKDHLGWVVTSFREDEGARKQCVWTDLPEDVRALAVERLGITMPECRVRTIPTAALAGREETK